MRSEGRHLFTAEDLKLLVEHDIKVTSIESDAIDLEEEANKILNFKPVMKEMEYLNNFFFSMGHYKFICLQISPLKPLVHQSFG